MKTVLIVEENAAIRENMSKILKLHGYNILATANGKTGLAMANGKKPDIILCDVLVPEIDGYSIFNSLKDNPETMNIPFIFITDSPDKKNVEIGLPVDADGYITKSFEGKELCATIDLFLKPLKNSSLHEN